MSINWEWEVFPLTSVIFFFFGIPEDSWLQRLLKPPLLAYLKTVGKNTQLIRHPIFQFSHHSREIQQERITSENHTHMITQPDSKSARLNMQAPKILVSCQMPTTIAVLRLPEPQKEHPIKCILRHVWPQIHNIKTIYGSN